MKFYPWVSMCAGAALLVLPASGAVDGFEGMTSTGSLTLSVSLTARPAATIKITGLEDVSFVKDVGTGPATDDTQTACVYMSEAGTFNVQITANPLTANNQFYNYKLVVSDGTAQNSVELNVSNTAESETLSGITASTISGCSGEDPLQLVISDEGDLSGDFNASAQISLLVSPD